MRLASRCVTLPHMYIKVQTYSRNGLQNEPQNSNPTYPTCLVTVDEEGQIGTKLRSLLNLSLLGSTKVRLTFFRTPKAHLTRGQIIGYEHNWDDAADYPVQLVRTTSVPLMIER
jgi:hypothetical protein